MIYLDRSELPVPEILFSEKALHEKDKMYAFFMEGSERSTYRRYRFDNKITQTSEVRNALKDLFHHKCAYCESPIGATSGGDLELFRPKSGSLSLEGRNDPLHYWWLAYEWSNMYLVCQVCNRKYKGSYFPIEGERAKIAGDVSSETPLLIDPCNQDDFREQHIQFQGPEAIPLTRKGEISIRLYGLNRGELIRARKEALTNLESDLSTLAWSIEKGKDEQFSSDLSERISRQIISDAPYLACKWDNFKEVLYGFTDPTPYLPYLGRDQYLEESAPENLEKSIISEPKTAYRSPSGKKISRKSYSLDKLENREAREAYFGQNRWIERVKIKNFKIIDELTLDFTKARPDGKSEFRQPWMALLGENGTGKSTVLQAIALTLAGEERVNQLNLDARKFVNRNTNAHSGSVQVFLSDRKRPITLDFDKSSEYFRITPKTPQVIVRAYGATRLFSREPLEDNLDYLFIDNLFDPFAVLLNGEDWIKAKMAESDAFSEVAKSLAELLSLEEDQYFFPEKDEESGETYISLKLHSEKQGIPLDDLSAGYKAVLAIALDIIMGFGQVWPSIRDAQGIVLVDEIGVHLHPRWKMRIVSALRRTFPNLNFVIATHEPLCLRGLEDNEVILIQLDENQNIEIIRDLPSPKNMRVGQLLTSVFGLHTTMDPELEQQYSEFYQLQSIRNRTPEQEDRFEELKTALKDHMREDPVTGEQKLSPVMGDELRENMMFEIIDKRITQFRTGKDRSSSKLAELKGDALKEVEALWKNKL